MRRVFRQRIIKRAKYVTGAEDEKFTEKEEREVRIRTTRNTIKKMMQ